MVPGVAIEAGYRRGPALRWIIMTGRSLDLLNIYELMEPDGPRHLVVFLEPLHAQLQGIVSRAVVGEFVPRPDGEFDPATFRLNPEFVAMFVQYMNEEAIQSPELLAQAEQNPSSHLYLVDPRNPQEDDGPPPASDLLGRFSVDAHGRPVPGSFEYNPAHAMFDPVTGPSEILTDRKFYNWLHPIHGTQNGTGRPPRSDLPIVP